MAVSFVMADEPSIAAGQAALQAGRWDEARSIFESVLRERETAEVLLGLGEAWWWLGNPRRTVEYYERGYVWCRRAGDAEGAIWAALWLALTYGYDLGNPAAFSGWLGRAETVFKESGASRMEGWLGLVQAHDTSDLSRSRKLAEQVIDVARNCGDIDLELCSLALLGELLVAMSEADKGLELIDEAMAGAFGGERTQFLTAVFAACNMIAACSLAADIERATHWCRVVDDFVREYGCPFLHATCRSGYGTILTATGHWAEGERELEAAIRLAEESYQPVHSNALGRLAELRLNQGRPEEAEILLTRIADSPAGAIPRAKLHLARGETGVAIALLQRHLKGTRDGCLETASVLELLVEAHLAAGEREPAAEAADQLDALAAHHRRRIIAAQAARARGLVIAARGDPDGAVAMFEEALGLISAVDLPLEKARIHLDVARLRTVRQPDVAIAEARTALATFEQLGATAHADAAGALLRSLGVTGRAGPRNLGVLTRRELEVLRLIGHGLSNPEIAGRLFISRKTASHHVSSVLSKLGLRTRSEAAAYAARGMAPGMPDRRM